MQGSGRSRTSVLQILVACARTTTPLSIGLSFPKAPFHQAIIDLQFVWVGAFHGRCTFVCVLLGVSAWILYVGIRRRRLDGRGEADQWPRQGGQKPHVSFENSQRAHANDARRSNASTDVHVSLPRTHGTEKARNLKLLKDREIIEQNCASSSCRA